MAAMEPLCQLAGIDSRLLSRFENFLFEVDLFARLCEELNNYFLTQERNQFYLHQVKEKNMLEEKLACKIVADIVSTGEYAPEGIAYYTQAPEDVIYEIFEERNTNPSSLLLRKIIELHRCVRPSLYQEMMKKIIKHSIIK